MGNAMNKHFLSGDIGISTSNALMSKIIRFFSSWHTGKATKSHAFAFVNDELIVEALGKIRLNPVSSYSKETFDIYRLPLLEEDRKNFRLNMLREVNDAYGWTKLPLFALDSIATKIMSILGKKEPVFFFTRYFGITSFRVCSQFVVWGLHKFTSYRIRNTKEQVVNWKIVSPDYLEDLLRLPINQAEKIYSQP